MYYYESLIRGLRRHEAIYIAAHSARMEHVLSEERAPCPSIRERESQKGKEKASFVLSYFRGTWRKNMLDSQKRKRIFSFFFSPSSSESGSPRVRCICRPLLYKMCIDGRVLRPIRVVAAKSSLPNSVNGTGLLLPCWKKSVVSMPGSREREG